MRDNYPTLHVYAQPCAPITLSRVMECAGASDNLKNNGREGFNYCFSSYLLEELMAST